MIKSSVGHDYPVALSWLDSTGVCFTLSNEQLNKKYWANLSLKIIMSLDVVKCTGCLKHPVPNKTKILASKMRFYTLNVIYTHSST
jgi:hypothetical protein